MKIRIKRSFWLGFWSALDPTGRWLRKNLPPATSLSTVRHGCAFCGRERTPKDDNHAPGCPYWDFFG